MTRSWVMANPFAALAAREAAALEQWTLVLLCVTPPHLVNEVFGEVDRRAVRLGRLAAMDSVHQDLTFGRWRP